MTGRLYAALLLCWMVFAASPAVAQDAVALPPPAEAEKEKPSLGFAALPEAEAHYRSSIELLEAPSGLTEAGRKAVREEFEKGLALEPQNLAARILFARVLLRLGGDDAEAIKILDDLVREYPEDADVRQGRGLVSLGELARFDVAEEDFAWLAAHGRGTADHLTALGFARFQQGKLFSARQAFRDALAEDPAAVEARSNLGWVEFKDGRPAEALGHFAAVVEKDPQHVGAHFGLAKVYEETGDLGKAIDEYNVLLSLMPNFVYFLDLLILYIRHYQIIFYVLGGVIVFLFVRTWVRTVRRDRLREAQAAKMR
ncbi:MAG: tetratricopeptide repeat protein [Bdellovibrionota bacterium]